LTLQLQLQLFANDGGSVGERLGEVTAGSPFFLAILVGDIRPAAGGVIGFVADLQWNPDRLTSTSTDISFNPADVITSSLPFLLDGLLDNSAGLISRLTGAALPEFEIGQPIGSNQLEVFATLSFLADTTVTVANFTLSPDSAGIAFADDYINTSPHIPDPLVVFENSSPTIIKISDSNPTDILQFAITGGADKHLFKLDASGELSFMQPPNFEHPLDNDKNNTYEIVVEANDNFGEEATSILRGTANRALTIQVADINEAPTALGLAAPVPALPEITSTASRIKLADIVISDDALGSNSITLSGADAGSFEVSGTELFLKAGTALNFEAKASYAIIVSASDSALPGSTPVSAAFNLAVSDVNEPPTAVALTNTTASLAENTPTSSRIKLADIAINDDALGTNAISLLGADAAAFEVEDTVLYLKAGTSLNYESKSAYAVAIVVGDSTLGGSTPVTTAYSLAVTDVNEAPTAVALTNVTAALPENTATNSRIKLADIAISDDALGTNTISLLGADAAAFEVEGTVLYLKAGTSLDYETKASYSLTLSGSDPSLPDSNPVSTAFALGLISFIDPPVSDIWDQPGNAPSSVATWSGISSQVDGSTPVQVGGIGNTWTTTDAPAGSTNQVVLSGQNNTLNLGAGQAQIQSIGQGNTIEAVQELGDATKIISTGSFGAGTESPPPPIINAAASTTGNVIGQISTIDAMAGGMIPSSGLYSYATGGTGNDLLYGSVISDFLRGGMGNDTIIAYAGNDIVRGGAGSDQMTLGSGNDKIYYTFDQLQNGDVDTVTDFNAIAGDVDILAIQADRVGGGDNYDSFRGFGTNSLIITDSIDGSVTTVVAQAGYQWKPADIFFGV